MARADRLPLVQYALNILVGQLGPRDRVTLITYGTRGQLRLEAMPASQKTRIRQAVGAIECGSSTNILAGIQLGYQMAARHFRSGEINRIILCSDGVANVGPADAEELLEKVSAYRKQGITLTSVGVGEGSYDDTLLEQLANKGDGNYVFIDGPAEARRVFVEEMAATLQTIASDVKIQVEFNPQRVRRYRLIGYENRAVADKDFRNDAVDAGEIGSGQAGTALYELELWPDRERTHLDVGTVYVRYRDVDTAQVEEFASRLSPALLHPRTPAEDPRFFLAACAAEFAELLRGSEHAAAGALQELEQTMIRVANALPLDARVQELLVLIQRAQGLPQAK
jgi:Ca-activated chloride channel family protein